MAFGDLKGTFGVALNSAVTSNVATGSAVAVVAGDLVYAVFAQQTALTVSNVADSLGNTYTATNVGTDAGSISGRAFYQRITSDGTLTSLTGTAVSSANNIAFGAAVFAGPFADPPIDANPSNITAGSAGTSYTCPATGTLAQPIELVVAWMARGAPATDLTAVAPNLEAWHLVTQTVGLAIIGYQTTNSTSSLAPVFTSAATAGVRVLGANSFMFQPDTRTVRAPSSYKYQRPDWSAAFAALSYRNIACLAVTAAAAPFPFSQDWPNPQRPRQPISSLTHTDAFKLPLQQTLPVGQQFLTLPPKPAPRVVTLLTHTDAFKLPLQQVIPLRQNEWIVPPSQRRNLPDWQDYILPWSQAPPSPPPTNYDWPNPRAALPLPLGNVDSFKLPLQTVLPPRQTDWPNPRGSRPLVLDWIVSSDIALLTAVVLDTRTIRAPNSYRYQAPLRNPQDWQDWYKLPFTVLPFNQYDWPVPKAPRVNPQDWQDWITPIEQVLPIAQHDWPVPKAPRVNPQDWPNQFWAIPVNLNISTFKPCSQNDWPVPTAPASAVTQLTWTDSFKLPLQEVLPFVQTDWPNPTAPRRGSIDWLNNQLPLVQAVPLSNYDWPNPRIASRNPQDWQSFVLPNLLPPQSDITFPQYDWPVPQAPVRSIELLTWTQRLTPGYYLWRVFNRFRTWELSRHAAIHSQFTGLNPNIISPVLKPSAQYDWPVPRGPVRPPPQHIDFFKLLLQLVTPPFFQHDWPTPSGPRPVPTPWILSTPLPLLSPPITPAIAQYDWPNPRAPKPLVQDWQNSFPLQQQAILPFSQEDWPVPKAKARASVLWTWTDSFKLPLQQRLPTRQTDWPVPRGPRTNDLRGWTARIDLPAITPPKPLPFPNHDWPVPRGPRQPVITLRFYTQGPPPPKPPVYDSNLTIENEIFRIRYLSNESGRIRYMTNEERRTRDLTK